MMFSVVLVLGVILQLCGAVNTSAFTALLRQSLSPQAQIFLPTDANYTNETVQRWTTYGEPTYFASVKPAIESDIQTTIKLASEYNVPFLGTGGGHGYTDTYRFLKNGLEIDLSNFKNVSVDASASTLTIGGAVLFRDIFDPLYDAGKEIQTGTGTCVGMLGATLGGGVGRYQGLHGMILDALLSVRMVIASGEIVTASATENADLFWGIRGAGFNFGIVTSATYKVENLTNGGQVLNADFVIPGSANESFWEILKSYEADQPAELALATVVNYDEEYGGPNFILNAVYIGPEDVGMPYIQPFIDLAPLKQNISIVSWNNLDAIAFFGLDAASCVDGSYLNLYGLGINTFDVNTFVEVFGEMVDLWNQYPEAQGSSILIEEFAKQAVLAVPDGETAYPHRNITAQILFSFEYPNSTLDDTINSIAHKLRAQVNHTSGFDGLQVYVSYGHGDEGVIPWYSERKLPNLTSLKSTWDPHGLFSFNNPITF